MRRGADLTGFSGLGALLSGAADGFAQGQRISSQRNADKLAREREARYERERLAQEEERRLARERQRALDAMAGLLPADSVDQSERIMLRDNSAVRGGMDAANRALASLAPGSGFTPMLAGPEDQTTERYRRVGDRVIDRSIADPEVKRIRAEEQERVERGNARRGLLALRGPDGASPLFRPEEVLGQQASGIAALQQYGATAGVRERDRAAAEARVQAEANRKRQEELAGLQAAAQRERVNIAGLDPQSAREAIASARGLREYGTKLRMAQRDNVPASPTYNIQRDAAGNLLAINTKDPADVRAITPPGQAGAAAYMKSTEAERKAAGWAGRAAAATSTLFGERPGGMDQILGQASTAGANDGLIKGAIKMGLRGAASPLAQRYAQAELQFAQAVLRKDTGATINDDEIGWIRSTYLPQPNDPKELVAQKLKASDDAIIELAISGNRALSSPEAGAARRMIDEIMNPATYSKRRAQQYRSAGYTDENEIKQMVAGDLVERFGRGGS